MKATRSGFNNQRVTIYWKPNHEPSTYEQLAEYLIKGKNINDRPIANNTRVIRRAEKMIAIRLHNTDIITFYENGAIGFNSDGWKTVTTKDRMNRFTPRNIGIESERGIWYLIIQSDSDLPLYHKDSKRYLFEDGIHILSDGSIVNSDREPIKQYTAKQKEIIRKKINKINLFSKELVKRFFNGQSKPNPGDCFCCQGLAGSMPETNFMIGEVKNGQMITKPGISSEHIKSHLDEKYYVGSLVIAALNWNEEIGVYGLAPIDRHNIAVALNPDAGHQSIGIDLTLRRITMIVKRFIKMQFGFGL